MSKVYRFHRPTAVPPKTVPKLLRKRKVRQAEESSLIASDAFSITDANGTRPIETFRDHFVRRSITLTRIEADLIALSNPGIHPPIALEDVHPWLPRKPFLNNSAANYRVLCSIVRRYGGHLVTAAAFCDQKWNTVCNAIRMKNDLDARFYTAWHLPIQDAGILEERRADRSVVAIDVNAMYPACMQQQFPKPAALRLVSYNRDLGPDEVLPLGLYQCILRTPSVAYPVVPGSSRCGIGDRLSRREVRRRIIPWQRRGLSTNFSLPSPMMRPARRSCSSGDGRTVLSVLAAALAAPWR